MDLTDYLVQGSITIDFAKVVSGVSNEEGAVDQILKLIASLDTTLGVKFFSLEGESEYVQVDEVRMDSELVVEEVNEFTPKKYKVGHQIGGLATNFYNY